MSTVNTEVSFKDIAVTTADYLKTLTDHNELYVTTCDGDAVYAEYLASFPAGTDPIFKERTEHDCQTCRNFIKNVGKLVAIVGGEIVTVWDVPNLPYPYSEVFASLSRFVKKFPIDSVYRDDQPSYGAKSTMQVIDPEAFQTRTWNHFYWNVPKRFHLESHKLGECLGESRNSASIFRRGLDELNPTSLKDVKDLISANSLYRGAEFADKVNRFIELQTCYLTLDADHKSAFVWQHHNDSASRLRNTVIGTLIQDLSEGVEFERAVQSFENKVAPTNYKRPNSIITPRMVEDAVRKVRELGLEEALYRRYARISDISVNNVLFVDNAVRSQMRDGLTSLLMDEVRESRPNIDRASEIKIEEFIRDVVPKATSIELLVTSAMLSNFVSLTAPVHRDSGRLLQWNNDFAWAYDGNATDSIKERVKAAGGNVAALLRVSLSWFNFDDLDLHVVRPDGSRIYFGAHNRGEVRCGGCLDVDMNAGAGTTREAVENIAWTRNLVDGVYTVIVNNFAKRESVDVGFEIEIECDGQSHQFKYQKPVANKEDKEVAKITIKNGRIVKMTPAENISGGGISKEKWGVTTESLIRVDSMMLSPNFWDDNAVGNKHYFFMLHGCRNPESIRGLYNEYLNPTFTPHRKVFEVLGDKLKCPVSDDQLSGVGFSSTRRDRVQVMVNTSEGRRPYNLLF